MGPRLLITLLAILLLGCSACMRIPRQRTLPPSIRSLSIPVFINRTAEPQLEDDATVFAQEEFLADGRLDMRD